MGEAFGQMLPLAVAIAANPIPISVVVLMLGGPRALANGLAFTAGWLAGIAALGTLALILADEAGASDDGQPSTWVDVLKLALGAALVVLAILSAIVSNDIRGRQGALMMVYYLINTLVAMGFGLLLANLERLAFERVGITAGTGLARFGR